ncbi:MAG TPA: FtsQ-type POTRA domain-containing protein [Myxococcales bacterium]|jgi:cell division protein FtsQ|nr:FtsQ-type POTRA domain-containing protein [Myxococcales bacterium]
MSERGWMRVPFRPVRSAARRVSPPQPRGRGAGVALLRTAAAVLLSAALSVGAWEAFRWSTTTPFFALRDVKFTGLAHAAERDLLARSGLQIGANLMSLDLAAAARGIETHPWVASARLSRSFPGTVLAEIVEHRAAAQVQLGGLYLLDDEGRVFKRVEAGDAADVPLVTGVSREAWLRDKGAAQLRLYSALHLLEAWRAEGLSAAALEEVRVEDDGGFTAFAREPSGLQEVRLGSRDLPLQLQRLTQLRAALARRGEHAARIELDNQARPEWVSAQLVPASR